MMSWDQTTIAAFLAGGAVAITAGWSAQLAPILVRWLAKKLGV